MPERILLIKKNFASRCAMIWYCREDNLEKGPPSNNRGVNHSAECLKISAKFFRCFIACFRRKPSQNLRMVFQSKTRPTA